MKEKIIQEKLISYSKRFLAEFSSGIWSKVVSALS